MNITNYNLFPSIANYVECDNFSEIRNDLIDWIYNYKTGVESVHFSNRGGWQSPSNFYVNNPTFDRFRDYIVNHALESTKFYGCKFYLSNMWINVNGKENYNMLHDHPVSVLSGVIWIKTPENSGNLIFHNPHSFAQSQLIGNIDSEVAKKTNYYFEFYFQPQEGCMAIFPSDLMHYVGNNQSDDERISISFNLGVVS